MQLSRRHLFVLVILFMDVGLGQPTEKPPKISIESSSASRRGSMASLTGGGSPRLSSTSPSSPGDQNKWRLVDQDTCGTFLELYGFDEHVRVTADESLIMIKTAGELLRAVINTPKQEWIPLQQSSEQVDERIKSIHSFASISEHLVPTASQQTVSMGIRSQPSSIPKVASGTPPIKFATGPESSGPLRGSKPLDTERDGKRQHTLLVGIRALSFLLFGFDPDMKQQKLVASM